MNPEDKEKSPPLELPGRNWYDRLNLLNILLILFFFLTIFSGKNLIQDNRPADVMAGIRYFLKKFFPPDFSDFSLILDSLGETFQIAIVSTFIAVNLSLVIALGASRNISPIWLKSTATNSSQSGGEQTDPQPLIATL